MPVFRYILLHAFCLSLLYGALLPEHAVGHPSISHPTRTLDRYASVIPFYKSLALLHSNASTHPVTVLQIGDSHTANDAFSGQMRDLLQTRFQSAGRGVLQPGIPFSHYHPAHVTVSARGWTTISAFDKNATGPWGLSLIRQHTNTSASMTITSDELGGLEDGAVEFLGQPGGGDAIIQADDGRRIVISTAFPQQLKAVWFHMPATRRTQSITVSALGNGPVDILSWEAKKGSPARPEAGITYSNLGVIGSTIHILGRLSPQIVSEEIKHLDPKLIIIAFGTNEGFNSTTDFDEYSVQYEQIIQTLHETAPKAGLAVIMPPDGVHREARAPASRSCAKLAPRGKFFATPAALNIVRDAQKLVAQRKHWMQWDWRQAMADRAHPNGRCAILVWGRQQPPAAANDHVHLLKPGYQKTAMSFYDDLMNGYTLWSSQKKKK